MCKKFINSSQNELGFLLTFMWGIWSWLLWNHAVVVDSQYIFIVQLSIWSSECYCCRKWQDVIWIYLDEASRLPVHTAPVLQIMVWNSYFKNHWDLTTAHCKFASSHATYIIIIIGHVNIGIIFLCIGSSQWCLFNTQSILIGCSTLHLECCKLIGWCWKIMRNHLWMLTCPIIYMVIYLYSP